MKRHSQFKITVGALAVVGLIIIAGLIITTRSSNDTANTGSIKQVVGNDVKTNVSQKQGESLTDQQIAGYQDQAKTKNDAGSYASLGLAYLQKAREVGDPVYYTKAEGVLKKALELDANNLDAIGGMGSLTLSRHQFAQALEWGQKGVNLRPDRAYNYGVMTDALVELGRYDEAVVQAQKLVDLRPDLSSYARVSYLRELHGLYDGAIQMMNEAIIAGGPATENVAYVTYQLGLLYFNKNDIDNAEKQFQKALAVSPGYVYAQQGLAKVKAARGDLTGALALYTDISARYPLPQFIIEEGDLLTLMGRTADATKQYDLVRGIDRIYKENGVDTDAEMALFNADHDYNLTASLATAKREYAARPSIHTADVLAWTLYKSGDYKAAADASKNALRLGTHDSLYLYHAAMISNKLGDSATARDQLTKALAYNPNFSFLYASTAKTMLAGMKS